MVGDILRRAGLQLFEEVVMTGIPRDIKKEAERIAILIFRNQKFDDAIDLIAAALTTERERQSARRNLAKSRPSASPAETSRSRI